MGTPAVVIAHRPDLLIAEWLVQPSLGTVSRGPESHHLEPKTMEVLLCLAGRASEVVSKDELIAAVWPDTFVSEHVLTHAVWQLRQVFGDDGLIQTVPRRGYRLTQAVRPAVARIRSLAVLPLANLTGDPEQEYFADGMTEALITALAQIAALRVISRTSAMQYKATAKPLPQIAAELNVEGVVEGSVARSGDRVRICVQLVHARTDQHLWARSYEAELRDVLSVQDDVARAIAGEIQVQLTPAEQQRLTRAHRIVPAAHEAYLKGLYCFNRASEDGLRMSIAYMQQAIELDPQYAAAYAGLANSISLLASPVAEAIAPDEANRLMRPAVARALELDDQLSEAHTMLGWIKLYYEWDWAAAEAAERHAVHLNPSYWQCRTLLGTLYEALAWREQAIAEWRRSCELDPRSIICHTLLGWTLVLAGRWDEGVEQLQQTARLEPNHWFCQEVLGLAMVNAGRHGEAMRASETAVRLSPDVFPKGTLAHVYARCGRGADARSILDELEQLACTRYVSPALRAFIFGPLGQPSRALDLLEQAFEQRDPCMIWIRSFENVWGASLRHHPRFEALLERMNFPD